MTRVRLATLIAAAAVAAAVVLAVQPGPAGATTALHTASTTVTNRDDSGANGGNWATDNFTRTLTLFSKGVVANSNCPGITIGACYHITGAIHDKGTFTTVPGNPVPGNGSLNGGSVPDIGVAVTGAMTGTFSFDFYTNKSLAAFDGTAVPSVDGDSPGTGVWPEQFFSGGTQFWDTTGATGGSEYLGTTGSWSYTAALGSDSDCKNVSGRWVDASPDWGVNAADGN